MALPDNLPPPSVSGGRILALDVGARTLGLAVSDPLGITAQGLETLRRRNLRSDLEHLERLLRQYQVAELVVGNPLRLSGQPGAQAEKVAAFAERLRARFGLPVHLWDERLTSAEANRLLRETAMSIRRRSQVVDRLAATLILQSFLDFRAARRAAP
ncbi:MAG TPA: Holliday junction resolvase RuvX [Terriglobales bacterium]|nr:Holliday junction resolvase RuvX [Terriglobales bacterium]